MLSLSDLKKSSQKNLEKLIQESARLSRGAEKGKADERFWAPTIDKVGTGFALIRFIPAPTGDSADGMAGLPWTTFFDHGFKGPSGKWYIEKSLTSIKKADPVGEFNSKLWATNEKEMQDQARAQKRRQSYVSNILVINDPSNAENNGKVFLFKYGVKIFEKVKNVMTPDEELGEESNDPFDFWGGQTFKLKIKQVGGYRNYDDSSFNNPSPIADSDDKIDAIWTKAHSLKEFTDPANYKGYDELKKKLHDVLEIKDGNVVSTAEKMSENVAESFDKETAILDKVVASNHTDDTDDLAALLKDFD